MVPLSCCIDMYFCSPTQDISIMTMLRGVRMNPCTDIGLSAGEKRRGGALTGVDQSFESMNPLRNTRCISTSRWGFEPVFHNHRGFSITEDEELRDITPRVTS